MAIGKAACACRCANRPVHAALSPDAAEPWAAPRSFFPAPAWPHKGETGRPCWGVASRCHSAQSCPQPGADLGPRPMRCQAAWCSISERVAWRWLWDTCRLPMRGPGPAHFDSPLHATPRPPTWLAGVLCRPEGQEGLVAHCRGDVCLLSATGGQCPGQGLQSGYGLPRPQQRGAGKRQHSIMHGSTRQEAGSAACYGLEGLWGPIKWKPYLGCPCAPAQVARVTGMRPKHLSHTLTKHAY